LKAKDNNKSKGAIPLIAHFNPKGGISEQYRLIRSNILFSSVDNKITTIMITSPEPSDGKSTTASNLSVVLAQQGNRVLLVDADLRKPSIHFAFQTSNILGLTSILTKESDLEGTLIKTFIPNLEILTSGPIPPNPSELLNSRAMEKLMHDLSTKFDYVVFDTPPVISVTDAQIIGNKCDGVVLVVASGKTHKDRALQAKELLEKAKSRILGIVVNGVDSKSSEYYSQYG
jgi:capsular exopolysaccharide synthesis family protein